MAQRTATPSAPHRIGLGQAVALYTGAVLGAGVLVLPGQAASLAGPSALLAWLFLGLLGLPLALTFAALATEYPDAGGIATYAAKAFGPNAGGVAGWFYYVAVALGHVIVPLTGGYYIAVACDQGGGFAFVAAAAILALACAANLAGLRLSARLQLAVAAGVALLLLVATLVAIPQANLDNLTPFAPHGLPGIGQAAVVLFFAFAGWEAIAHLAGEFDDVRRDLRRATLMTVVIVLVLYLGVAFAVVSTSSYGTEALDRTSVGRVLGDGIGVSAATASGVLAFVISLGTTNAFMASISRLGYALGRDGWMPSAMSRLNARAVPAASVLVVTALGAAGLIATYVAGGGAEDIVGVPAALVLVTYLIGTAAAVRLLSGRARVVAGVAFLLTAAIAPFAAGYIVVPVLVAVAALAYRWAARFRPSEPFQ
ncbi:amino acid permease [Nocardioidaceae bacterium SCSIO 66511]|nr:amino acid permease [Nocardioidaceae bacterium SCSIO 66511]